MVALISIIVLEEDRLLISKSILVDAEKTVLGLAIPSDDDS